MYLPVIRMITITLFVLSLTLGFASASQPSSSATPMDESRCEALSDIRDLTIFDTKIVTNSGEIACKVQGVTGPGLIHYAVRLPLLGAWNGRFLMSGDGGHDGDIDLEGPRTTDTTGYVVANSDMGHSRITSPGSTFAFNNRQAEIDYGYRAVHTTVLAAERLIQEFYGRPPDYSYFVGCSTGGREAAVEAQRYPDDFDGIVAGSLFNNAIEISMEQVWSSALFFRDVNGDGVGFDNLISMQDIQVLREAVLAKCDVLGNDKIRDNVVDNPLQCSAVFTDADINSLGAQQGWSPGQTQAIKEVYAGPHDSTNTHQWYPGKPLGTEYAWGYYVVPTPGQFPEGNNMAPFQTGYAATLVNQLWFENDPGRPTANPLDPTLQPKEGEYRWLDFDFDRNTPLGGTANPIAGPWNPSAWSPSDGGGFMRQILNGSETDLTPFLINNDAKYLLYHGWGDALIPGQGTVNYYEQIVADTFDGNTQTAQTNVRLFMVPGMGHCGDEFGLGSASEFDRLEPIVDWVENGNPPESIEVTHTTQKATVDNERIVCPWPQQPTYVGPSEGNAENKRANWVASNFQCQPQQLE